MNLSIITTPLDSTPRSHRRSESPDHYARRLARGGLKIRRDAERAAVGLGTAEHAPWASADILEWQNLAPTERYLDLKGYALASDRIARAQHHSIQAEPLRFAA